VVLVQRVHRPLHEVVHGSTDRSCKLEETNHFTWLAAQHDWTDDDLKHKIPPDLFHSMEFSLSLSRQRRGEKAKRN
jgi:hypothetical protein